MNDQMLRDLLRRVQVLEDGSVRYRQGVVTDDSPLSVALGGSDVSYADVRAITGASLTNDDVVGALTFGNDLLVLGAVGAGPAARAFNVKDFGAIGDGIADDLPAITEALGAAQDAGGGVVFFPPGVYLYDNSVEANITFESYTNVSIVGSGRGASILRPADETKRFLYFLDCSNVGLRHLSIGPDVIAGVRNSNTNVEFALCSGVTVENCEVFDTSSLALAINGCSEIRVVGNYVHDSLADGIHFVNCDQALVCRDNHVKNTEDDGIAVWTYSDAESDAMFGAVVAGNLVEECAPGRGILLGGSSGVTVSGNTTKNTVGPGIHVCKNAPFSTKGCRRITVVGNVVIGAVGGGAYGWAGGYAAIEVSEWDVNAARVYNMVNEDITVVGNVVYKAGNQGIEVSSTKIATVTGNTIRDSNENDGPHTANMAVNDCTGVAVSGNVIFETRGTARSSHGIYLGNITDGVVTGNVMRGMTNPNIELGGTNTRLSILGNGDTYNYAFAGIAPPTCDLGIEIREFGGGAFDVGPPPVDAGRVFARDDGAGKTELCVRFRTGAIQVLAVEP